MTRINNRTDLLDKDYLFEDSDHLPFLINSSVILYTGIFGSVFTSCLLICYNLYILNQKRKIIGVLFLAYILELRVQIYFAGFEDGLYYVFKYILQIILSIGVAYPIFQKVFDGIKFQDFATNKQVYITIIAIIYAQTIGSYILFEVVFFIHYLFYKLFEIVG
jgi:hypothetical protein